MKRTLTAASLLVALAVPAFAGNPGAAALQSALNLRNIDADTSTLTETQVAQINAVLHSSDSAADKRLTIQSMVK